FTGVFQIRRDCCSGRRVACKNFPTQNPSGARLQAIVNIRRCSVLTDGASLRFNHNSMRGGRVTSEERSAISTYVGAGLAVVLIVGGLYFFFLAQKEKKETTTFDPNRSVPSDAVLKQRLKAEEYSVVREGGSQRAFQNQFWNNEKTGI